MVAGMASAQDVIEISTVEQLKEFRDAVNGGNGYAGKTVKLTADLDLSSEANWKPIGNLVAYPGQSFNGTFDGDNHVISNLTVNDNTPNYAVAALFGSVVNGTIKNLTVKNVDIQSTHYAAGIVAYTSNTPTIENCKVIGGTIKSTPEIINGSYDNGDKVGGIMGYATAGSTINNCWVEGVTISAYRDFGGIVGFSAGNVTNNTVKDVTLQQDLTNGYKTPTPTTIGDIIGRDGGATLSNNVVIKSEYVAQIGETQYETLAAAVADANAGDVIKVIKAGDYTLPNLSKNVTVEGAVDGVVFNGNVAEHQSIASIPNGATFKNVKFTMGQNNYHGFQHAGTINMENCTLDGKFFSYGDMNFTNCEFTQSVVDYHMWVYGAGNVVYDNCTFRNSAGGKLLHLYCEDANQQHKVTVKDCKFINNGSLSKAAINVKATSGTNALQYELYLVGNNTTEGSFPTTVGEKDNADKTFILSPLAQVDDRKVSPDNIKVYEDGVLIYPVNYVAQIGSKKYTSFEAAFAAVQDGETITLLKDCAGNGIKAPQGKFTTGVTVDFANFTYTVDGETVGSTGTETNGFQLLKDNKITFKNGTITSEKALILVQNYSDLTLQGMTLTLNNKNYASGYTLSNNNGNVVIDGSTINANTGGGFAFDCCRYASYPSVNVTVKGESVINGNVEVSASGSDAKDGFKLMLEAGTMSGNIVLDATAKAAMAATPEKALVMKSESFTKDAPEGYKWAAAEEGTQMLVPVEYVAQIGSKKYETLAEAIEAATDGANTITLLKDIDLGNEYVNLNKAVTIDGQGYTITSAAAQAILLTGNGDVTITNTKVTASKGHGIQAGTDAATYSGALALNEGSVLTSAKRGIRVYKEDTGFAINVTASTIQSTMQDPETTYTTGNDAMGLSLGVTDDKGYNVTITNSVIKGFSYDINLVTSSNNLNVTMTGGATYGRAAVNTWGDNNNITLDGVEIHGINNQTGPTEGFACIVENNGSAGVAENNNYTIKDCIITGTLSQAAQTTEGSSATQYLMSLRGQNATVKVLGSTTYSCNAEGRGGFIDNESSLMANKLYFDDNTKATFANAFVEAKIAEEKEAVVNLYPVNFSPEVLYYWVTDSGNQGVYCKFAEPFTEGWLMDGEFIALQKDLTLTANIACALEEGSFTLTLGDYTIDAGEYSVSLNPGVTVNTDKKADIFSPAVEGYKVTCTATETGFAYTLEEAVYVAQYNNVKYETLQAALDAAEAADTENFVIELLADAELDITAWDGTKNPLSIGTVNTQSITINGNDHKLTFNQKNSDWNNVATMNDAKTKLVLNNMTISNAGHNDGPWNRCAVELNNVTSDKALAFKNDATLKNVTISDDSGDIYAVWIKPQGQTIDIDGLIINCKRGIKIDDKYVDTPSNATLNIANATFNTTNKSAILVKNNGETTINVGEGINIENAAADTVNPVWVDEDKAEEFYKVTVTGANVVPESKESDYVACLMKGEQRWGYYKGTDALSRTIAQVEEGWSIKLHQTTTEAVEVSKPLVITKNGCTADNVTAGEGFVREENNNEIIIREASYVAQIGDVKYETLQAALDAAEAADTENFVIELLADAELDIKAWDGPKNSLSIGTENTQSITINGNNHKLTFNQKDSDWNNVATMNDAQTKLVLNDMTISSAGYNDGCAVELNNVTSDKALAFKNDATLKNVTISDDSGDIYAVWISPRGQKVDIDGLTINCGRGIKIDDEYSKTPYDATLNIANATFNTTNKSAILVKNNGETTINAGEGINIENAAADTVNPIWVDDAKAEEFYKVTVTGANVVPEKKESDYVACLMKGEQRWGYYKGTDALSRTIAQVEEGWSIKLHQTTTEAVEVSKPLVITKNGCTADNVTAGEGFVREETDDEIIIKEKAEEVLVELIDGEPYPYPEGKECTSVTYKRTFKDSQIDKPQPWFVPFDYTITAEDMENFTFYGINMIASAAEAGEVEDESLVYIYIKALDEGYTLKANRPYVVKPKSAMTDHIFKAENITKVYAEDYTSRLFMATTPYNYNFYGNYRAKTFETHNQVMYMGGGMIGWNKDNATLGSYRWYIQLTPNGANDDYANIALTVVEEDGETNQIFNILEDNSEIEGIFTIGGIKVEKLVKGVNLIRYKNGQTKKVYIK